MTIRELIRALSSFDLDAKVRTVVECEDGVDPSAKVYITTTEYEGRLCFEIRE